MKLAFVWDTAHPQQTALEQICTATAKHVLRDHKRLSVELDVLFVSDHRMRAYNKTYRGKDAPTDVLSFAFEDRMPIPVTQLDGSATLGHVILNIDDLVRTSRKRKVELTVIARFLLVHGLLHLLGHDHQTKGDEKKMREAERRYCGDAVWYE